MTDLFDCVVAVVVAGLLNAAILAVLPLATGTGEASFLRRVYVGTLTLRAGLALALNLFASTSAFADAFWGDSDTFDLAGDHLARRWHGESTSAFQTDAISGYGFVYYVGAVYYVFGRNQLLVQLLNATIGSLTVLVIYAIANRLFGSAVARWSALFMAFFPQMLFWSAGMYKDPAAMLCIALAMFAVMRLRDSFSPGMAVLLASTAVALLTLRFYIFYFVALAALATFVFGQRGRLVTRLLSYGLLVAALAGALSFVVNKERLDAQASFMTLQQMQVTRADQAMWGSSAYGTEYDVSTPAGALQALPVGLIYLLFAPFPWAISGLRQLLTLPETLAWYALMPAFARGLAYSVRQRLREVLPILVFAVTLTIAYALTQGNVGTAYRQRTQVTMFFFVFMAAGIVQKSRQATRVPLVPALATPEPVAAAIVDRDFVFPALATPAPVAAAIVDRDFVFDNAAEPALREDPLSARAGAPVPAVRAAGVGRAFIPEPTSSGGSKAGERGTRRRRHGS